MIAYYQQDVKLAIYSLVCVIIAVQTNHVKTHKTQVIKPSFSRGKEHRFGSKASFLGPIYRPGKDKKQSLDNDGGR